MIRGTTITTEKILRPRIGVIKKAKKAKIISLTLFMDLMLASFTSVDFLVYPTQSFTN